MPIIFDSPSSQFFSPYFYAPPLVSFILLLVIEINVDVEASEFSAGIRLYVEPGERGGGTNTNSESGLSRLVELIGFPALTSIYDTPTSRTVTNELRIDVVKNNGHPGRILLQTRSDP